MGLHMRAMVGTPESGSYHNPWSYVAHPLKMGVPIGVDLNTYEVLCYDPWFLKELGVINSLMTGVLGNKNAGKSSLAKILFLRLASLRVMNDQYMRLRVNDRKSEEGQPEYSDLTRYFMSEPIILRNHRINIIDPTLMAEETELLDLVVNVCEFALDRTLQGFEPLTLQVGMSKMLREARPLASVELLASLIGRLTEQDFRDYLNAGDDSLKLSLSRFFNSQEFSRLNPEEQQRRRNMHARVIDTLGRDRALSSAQLQHSANTLEAALLRITRGDLGRIIGGHQSLRPLLENSAATYDWTGLNDKAVSLLRSIFWKVQTSALVRNDMSIMPHLDADDEDHGNWSDLMYARFKSEYAKKARAYPTLNLSLTHRIGDYYSVGSEGSEQRQRAVNTIRDVDTWFVGNQSNDRDTIHDIQSHLGFSGPDAHALTKLSVGQFAVKFGGNKPIYLQVIPTRQELEVIQTNRATKKMLIRGANDPRIREALERGKYKMIGA